MNDSHFIEYCCYFNGNQDYFECHEVLEEYWKEINGSKNHVLVGFILLATGLYHWRRGNHVGAGRTLKKAHQLLSQQQHATYFEWIHSNKLHQSITASLNHIQQQQPFKPFLLPITDAMFHSKVQQSIQLLPIIDTTFLMHKHTLRDRSDVISERQTELTKRRQKIEKR